MCQANLFKEILMIINTDSRRRARERERQNDAHGIVYALAERTNCICEENHLNYIYKNSISIFIVFIFKILIK